ncbi:MAG: 4a-hydroxytetrahydrobiopterin dehydratase [Chloroflexota bacterium]|nr:4a-hydroxytetrahydrobiopterin dehydratase [Chloroflexota bacterium]
MPDQRTTARAFHAAEGVGDWRVLFWGAYAHYRVRSFAEGARFVAAIAEIGIPDGHVLDVDLRPEGVTLRTSSDVEGRLGERDIELARGISEIARTLGLEPDPSQVQVVGIAAAQDTGADTRPFWAAALGYDVGTEDAIDRNRRGPHVSFQGLKPPRPGRGRTHIDVSVPQDQAEARVAAALAAGGRIADDRNVPYWWTLASPENHKVDIAAWPDFEDDDVF